MCFAGKKVLVVVSHQDDESLFFGGLLCNLSGADGLTVVCMSAAKQKRDAEARNAFFRKACETVGARPVTTPFRDARHVWSHVDLFFRKRPEQIAAMRKFLREQSDSLRPEVVVTHNEAGEYGHCLHKVVHRLCCEAFDPRTLYFNARGSKRPGKRIVVEYDAERKKRLMECYPTFDATGFSKRFFRQVITYQPETYVAAGNERSVATDPSQLRIYSDLTRDFVHFFHRKWRAKLGWW